MRPHFVILLAVLLAGCNSKPGNSAAPEAATETVNLFHEGKCVLLPEEMRRQFGLETAEVAEKPMRSQLQKLAQVFRTASDSTKSEAMMMLTIAEARELKPNQPVLLKAADSTDEMRGKLARVDESTRVALGQVEGLLEFVDDQQRYPVGAFLTATFGARTKNALVIPVTALLSAADGTFVYVVNGKHFTRTKIKTGAAFDGYIEIEEGLYAGDEVVARGVDNLWLIELSALKGGTPCCAVPKKQT
jgi:hypothetical protein